MTRADPAEQAEHLRRLHHGPDLLVLANAWDAATAQAVQDAGFPAVATTSAGVAAALGERDDDTMPADLAFAAVGRIAAAVDVPVTADLEAGYRLPADELAERLLAAGAVGCNLEDSDHHGSGVLVDAESHAERIAALKAAAQARGVDIVVNARTDAFLHRAGTPEEQRAESVRRGGLYLQAGADCVYPIGAADEPVIAALVEALPGPVNIWWRGSGLPLHTLARLGVRRVSLGSGLFHTAMQAVREAIEDLRR